MVIPTAPWISRMTFLGALVMCVTYQVSPALGQLEMDYDGDLARDEEAREFMIPHPRLGRYMDYAVLKFLANYLKDSYALNDMVPAEVKMEPPPDVLLQRELRDMKGKGYGIPIPRVGKRSATETVDLPPARSESNADVRNILAALHQLDHKRTQRQQPSVRSIGSLFKPRVGRGSLAPHKYKANWAPVPRVG
ncbi:uncharacterized protein LOC129586159 [Paramacrobiotus metropolitanus]|uniref:uncharacterized protein LOC129586159 n=1 Tax=Paramacrobiotus metropolitanus TaxID=2943436 RepID=UPI00244647B8|nr:uncharacterized protein LOC129586159 [Paramacrobiotus metropolitanus]